MLYLYVKAIHIIMVISWMAGLLYYVRLLIYHAESENNKSDLAKEVLHTQFSLMERRLWNIITQPAMILTWLTGLSMVSLNHSLLQTDWMWVKFVFVLLLSFYHFRTLMIGRQFKAQKCRWSSLKLRIWNEWSTVLLVAIVFTVVIKTAIDWVFGLIGLVALVFILMLVTKLYKQRLNKKQ